MSEPQIEAQPTPVAWRVRNDFGHWHPTCNKALADTWRDIEKLDVEDLYLAHPSSSVEMAEPPFLKALKSTAKIMRRAHDGGGDRLMSIWLDDVQAVEEAVAALANSRPHCVAGFVRDNSSRDVGTRGVTK